jgi:hypothetical protein
MDNRVIYISYATKGTPYIKVMEKYLLPSLQRFNLIYDIAYPENRGSWQANTHMKAEIIKEMLLKHKQPLVYIDSDATIESYPELFNKLEQYDIAAHYLDCDFFWYGRRGSKNIDLLSGTLYLNYNDNILTLIDQWIDENSKNTDLEQTNLRTVLEQNKEIKIYHLPIQYAAIVKMNDRVPDYIENPIIVHHQCSRLYRRKIK